MFNATFIVSLISFILFVIIMNQILYKPINDMVEKRKKFISDNYDMADENQKKSEAVIQDRLDKLQNTRSRIKEETAAVLNAAKKEQIKIQEDIENESKLKIEENIDLLNKNETEAINILKQDVINLAQIISDKFIETPEKITDIDSKTIEKIMQD